jgi:hypothetical protein
MFIRRSTLTETLHNDIALVTLTESVVFTNAIRPICMPSSTDVDFQNTNVNVLIAGWGRLGGES